MQRNDKKTKKPRKPHQWVAQLKPLDIERLISCDKKPATNESKTKLIKKYTQHLTTSDDLLQNPSAKKGAPSTH